MPRSFDTPLPIDAVLDQLARTLANHNAAVLVAPPGAGKTTRVPLALLDEPWARGKKIIVLEPRRIAARASAERMARTLGERAGETVGYRVRFGSKISRATRIEVVTEGIFSRQILAQSLLGVARERQPEVGIERALVEFVEQHGGDAVEFGVVEDLP